MNTKRLADKIHEKWRPMFFCLVIAVILYIFHQASMIESKTFVVPLRIAENGMVIHSGNTPNSVSVIIKAEDEVIKSILPSDISASISLDSITETGTYKLPVIVNLSERLMEFDPLEIKLKENHVTIEVDKKAIKYVPILPSVVGDVAYGYEIDTINITPSTVEIEGPEKILKATNEIYTTRINVSNAETNFSIDTSYQKLNKLLTVLDEGPFKAEVTVKAKGSEKEYDNIVVEIINLDQFLEVEEELPLVSLKLSGSMPVLENYVISKHSVQIDLSEVTEPGIYEIPIQYVFPANLQLIEKSDDELTVTVIKKSTEKIEKEKLEREKLEKEKLESEIVEAAE